MAEEEASIIGTGIRYCPTNGGLEAFHGYRVVIIIPGEFKMMEKNGFFGSLFFVSAIILVGHDEGMQSCGVTNSPRVFSLYYFLSVDDE